ncbi:hypothetical protein QBC34DRAFT_35065 [Podospora aff. communis PSN243]|uniref:Uncharacterized protein n=1 Tax=Podospora aff. communis PSN243 TaxID=3040156 RepID=A0AAV9GZ17_9PEZI|nr:hypothetical protein QBC34DRAFT_35065 [Podospora aff. communis PSN243]
MYAHMFSCFREPVSRTYTSWGIRDRDELVASPDTPPAPFLAQGRFVQPGLAKASLDACILDTNTVQMDSRQSGRTRHAGEVCLVPFMGPPLCRQRTDFPYGYTAGNMPPMQTRQEHAYNIGLDAAAQLQTPRIDVQVAPKPVLASNRPGASAVISVPGLKLLRNRATGREGKQESEAAAQPRQRLPQIWGGRASVMLARALWNKDLTQCYPATTSKPIQPTTKTM